MGIKGIYDELGPGRRVSLSKLTADSLAVEGRPLRVAIDIAIWQFQTQAARGGTNPAIRTLFYRLTRLLATPISPIFVFDGPQKPLLKRNKRSAHGATTTLATAQAKRLIRLFGFPIHDAPGEGEAECALLQKHNMVDCVLSEDVDTIMFGCTRTLRNWSAEGSKTQKTPTHVTMYDVKHIEELKLGLDREGMVLVALMSGGDYLPEGIRGCGVKVACEAARAGFGKSLCRLKSSDAEGIRAWRESLKHELHTNEKGYFRVRHKALQVPDDFPNLEVLRYYTHPVVSKIADLPSIQQKFDEPQEMQIDALREFTRETFGWDYRIGAVKFIRILGQALLVRQMLQDPSSAAGYIERITGSRKHFSTDATSELRVSYIPGDVVPIDLSKEVDEVISSGREGLALNSDEEFEAPEGPSSAGTGSGKVFDVSKPDLAWVLEDLARKAVPSAVSAWEVAEAAKALRKSPAKKRTTTTTKSTAAASRATKSVDPQRGAMEQYVKITKSTTLHRPPSSSSPSKTSISPSRRPRLQRPSSPPPYVDSSKPSTPSTTGSLRRHATAWTLSSSHSPSPPRTPTPSRKIRAGCTATQHPPETIILSSSPAGDSVDVFGTDGPEAKQRGECEAPAPAPAFTKGSPSRKAAQSVRKILAQSGSAGEVTGRRECVGRQHWISKTSPRKPATTKAKVRQTSIESFTTRQPKPSGITTPTKPRPPHSSEEPIIISSSPIINESTRQPSSPPLPRPSTPVAESPITLDASKPHPTPPSPSKKKLYIPRASGSGFFSTIEISPEEVDTVIETQTRRLEARGVRAGIVRWSDVSEIDLTADND